MRENITFVKDTYISNNNIDSIVRQVDTFHRFILVNSQTVVGNERRTFNRRTSKVIDAGDANKLILNISLQKKISEDLEISYILKSSNGIIVVSSVQKYTNFEDISNDLVTITDQLKYMYSDKYVEETIPVEEVAEDATKETLEEEVVEEK